MGSNNNPNKKTALALNKKVIDGVDKYFGKMKSVFINGTTYTPANLASLFQAEDEAATALDSTRAQLGQELATYRATKATAAAMRETLRLYILGAYGKAAVQMLKDFGMNPLRSKGKPTVKTKAEAVDKAKATRKVRNTMGKKQKKSIKGAPQQPATTTQSPPQGAPAASTPPAQVQQPTASHA